MEDKNKDQKQSAYPPVWQNFWEEAWAAIRRPRQYMAWAFQPFSRSVAYLALLCLFVTVVLTLYVLVTVRPAALAFGDWAKANIPALSMKGGQLSSQDDQVVTFTDSQDYFFKIDPTITSADDPHIDNFYRAGVLATGDELLVQSEGQEQILSYKELAWPDFSVSGEQINSFIQHDFIWVTLTVVPVVLFAYHFASKLIFTVLFAAVLFLLSRLRARFTQVWTLAIYALTPAVAIGYLAALFLGLSGLYLLIYTVYLLVAYSYYQNILLARVRIQQIDKK